MSNEFEAEMAKDNLDNSLLLEDGSKMNVYFSELSSVTFSSSNSGGVGIFLLFLKPIIFFLRLPSLKSQIQQYEILSL